MQLPHTYVRFSFGSFVFCARSGVGETDCERADWEVGVAPLRHQRCKSHTLQIDAYRRHSSTAFVAATNCDWPDSSRSWTLG
jgi:hypothetical protein